MNNNIPSPVAPNVVNNGYISGPPVTTSAMTGFGQPLANSGYINLLPQNMSLLGNQLDRWLWVFPLKTHGSTLIHGADRPQHLNKE
jgi:hypothetical protein